MAPTKRKKKVFLSLSPVAKTSSNDFTSNSSTSTKKFSIRSIFRNKHVFIFLFGLIMPWFGYLYHNFRRDGFTGLFTFRSSDNKNKASTNSTDKGMTYEQYISLAQSKKWEITDPVKKLHQDSISFCDAVIMSRSSDGVEDALKNEISMLINMFRKSKLRKFDLSYIVYEIIEATNQCYYQLAKNMHVINDTQSWISRKQMEESISSRIYYPIQEFFRLKYHIVNESQSMTTNSMKSKGEKVNRKIPKHHITLDFNNPMGRGDRNLLALCVYYRLHRVIRPLLSLDVNPMGAILEAVVNQDEYSVALLLQYPTVISSILSSESIDSKAYGIAIAFNNSMILDIFNKAQKYWNISLSTDTMPFHKVTSHNTSTPTTKATTAAQDRIVSSNNVTMISTTITTVSYGVEEDNGGYPITTIHIPNTISFTNLSTDSKNSKESKREIELTSCSVDRILLSEYSLESFYQNHIRLNKPAVLIDDIGLFERELYKSNWTIDNLVHKYSGQMATKGLVPYSILYSLTEEKTTIRNFLIGEDGLVNVTIKLLPYLDKLSKKDRLKSVVNKIANIININKDKDKNKDKDRNKVYDLIFTKENSKVWEELARGLPYYVFLRTIDFNLLDSTEGIHTFIENIVYSNQQKQKHAQKQRESQKTDKKSIKSNDLSLFQRILSSLSSSNNSSSKTPLVQFYVGPILSGAPFHSHGSALNVLMYGKKRWTLLPPSKDIYTSVHPILFEYLLRQEKSSMDSSIYQSLTYGCHLEQHSNEILFVPRHWSHQVINLAASVGFAVEVMDYY